MKTVFNRAFAILLFVLGILCTGCSKHGDLPSSASVPTLTTTAVTAITENGATTGGAITSDGGTTVSTRGVCWATHANPTIADTATKESGSSFTSSLVGLASNTNYYVRAYATNSAGTGYGNQQVFTTLPGLPTVQTIGLTLYNGIYTASGTVVSDGGSALTAQGICWSTKGTPTVADNWGTQSVVSIFNIALINVEAKVTYHYRAFATNALGTSYGKEMTFATPFALGLLYQGGAIFSLDNSGKHGLVVSTDNLSVSAPWAPGNLYATATQATSTTDGAANTTNIINAYGNSLSFAAKLCQDYHAGGYSDWFLPAQKQLNDMLLVRDSLPNFPIPTLSQPIPTYWSSTESDYFHAWDYGLKIDTPIPAVATDEKRLLYRVRAVRAF